jgi:hypothetical protein
MNRGGVRVATFDMTSSQQALAHCRGIAEPSITKAVNERLDDAAETKTLDDDTGGSISGTPQNAHLSFGSLVRQFCLLDTRESQGHPAKCRT